MFPGTFLPLGKYKSDHHNAYLLKGKHLLFLIWGVSLAFNILICLLEPCPFHFKGMGERFNLIEFL